MTKENRRKRMPSSRSQMPTLGPYRIPTKVADEFREYCTTLGQKDWLVLAAAIHLFIDLPSDIREKAIAEVSQIAFTVNK